ncbi:MAG TPA: Lpg1974 family pore-forming outer membrane protein [Chlamydiales bacterium]|nr:Lpg1974 family pore-forming outer membrane protein [Chlamydiales bacterium]
MMQQPQFIPCCRNINPSARGCPGNCGFFINADFLYWRADENDLPYAFVQTENGTVTLSNNGVNAFTQFVPVGYFANIDFNWRAGFRVGAGWNTPYGGWDTLINWTWYRNSTIDSVHEDLTFNAGQTQVLTGIVPIVSIFNGTNNRTFTDSARAHWTLLYNMIDLELGRAFYVAEELSLRPFIAVRGGWIDRKLSIEYGLSPLPNNNSGLVVPSGLLFPNTLSFKNNYWGIGPRFGINTDWRFCNGFMILGDLSAALLYGKVFKDHIIDIDYSPWVNFIGFNGAVTPGQTPLTLWDVKNRKHVWRGIPNFQWFLGFGWGDCINCNKMYFSIKAGWEANIYLNIQNFTDDFVINNAAGALGFPSSHTLTLMGATISAKLDF